MFRSRVFGGTPDGFHLACEYGPASVQGSSNMPTPEALTPKELDWTSAEVETQVLERFAQRQSALLSEHTEERVSLQLSWEPMPHAADFPNQRLCVKIRTSSAPPVLRSLHFTRTSGSGTAPESLVTGLLQRMELSTVWKLRASEGYPQHFWANCTDAQQWRALFNLNLSSCGLVSLPSAIGQLASLHVLRLNHNKLTSLPQELGQLGELEVLSVNHNQLTTLPAELRRCSALRELHLEYNRLVTPLLDLTHATALESLQLYGNPLEYLPELAPAVGLRSLSLANVRILADTAYSRWEVEVTAPSSSYTSMVIGSRGHKLQPLFNLVFRRSSVQHPLLAGAMSRLIEEPSNLELLVREDVALQQLVLASMGSNPLVVQQAVKIMSAVGAYAGAAKRLVKHNVVRAITGMLASGDKSLQLSGLRVLSSLAAGAAEGELPGEVLVPTSLLDRLLDLIRAPDTHQEVRCATLHALGNSAFDASNRRRYLQSPGLMQLLVMLAAAPDTTAPRHNTPSPTQLSTAAASKASPAAVPAVASVQQRQEAEAEGTAEAAAVAIAAAAAAAQDRSTGAHVRAQPRDTEGAATIGADAQAGASASTPVAPNPQGSARSGSPLRNAAIAASGQPAGPPTLVMSRAVSTTDNAAGAEPVSMQGAESTSTGSDASFLSPPRKAMAAAAGVAAAAAAAGDAVAAAPAGAAADAAASTAAPSGKKGAAANAATPAAAADAILPPKRKLVTVNNPVKLQAIRLLGILGQNEQVRIALGQPSIRGRGLRVLAMDGGGMKGMAMVELLRQLERRAGAPIWTLFDVIGGTSTGGLLAVCLGLLRLNLDACQEIYTSLGNKVFNQSTAVQEDAGWRDNLYRMYTTSSANMRVAVYGSKHDAANYEELLRKFCAVTELGCASDRLIDTAVMGGPKVFVVATLASSRPAAPFAFRNYELPDEATPIAEQLAACSGSCKHHVWEAVRASSAAPYYLDDFLTADGKRFQDGATTANNPTIIALQQARLLHPQLPVDCVVSLGCGSEPRAERSKGLSTVIDTGAVLLESACSVDRVHEALATTLQLVPGCQYFRFNAVDARCNMELDDIRPESWSRLMSATSDYCSQPAVAAQFDRLATLLKQGSPASAAATAGQHAHANGTAAAAVNGSGAQSKTQSHVVAAHGVADKAGQNAQLKAQHQQHQLQQQTGQLLLRKSVLGSFNSPQQQHSQQQFSSVSEGMDPGVLVALQKAAADGTPSSAPRLLYQRNLLLVQACREVASAATAAAAAQGVDVSALQQQEHVAQLLAAALPQDLCHSCDLSAATGAAAAVVSGQHSIQAANHLQQQHAQQAQLQQSQHPQVRQQQRQALQLKDLATAAKASQGGAPCSADPSPRHAASRHGSAAQGQLHSTTAEAVGAQQRPQRASETGVTALASPKPASWLDFIFPWQGAASAGNSPRHQQLDADSSSSRAGVVASAAAVDAAAGSGVQLPTGAWAYAGPAVDSSLGSPPKGTGYSTVRRAAADARPTGHGMPAVQSSPDLLPPSSGPHHHHQQQQESGSPLGGSIVKIKSLPAHYCSSHQQQQYLDTGGGYIRSTSNSPVFSNMHMAAQSGSHSSRSPLAGSAHDAGAAVGSSGHHDQQQHAQQQQLAGCAAVSEALRQQLISAAGRVGVVHLALHATEAGLVAGWQQQLAAIVEPGPEAQQLLAFLADGDSDTASGRLSHLVATKGPVLQGPEGALVAVLAQQQVLAPAPLYAQGQLTAAAAAAGGAAGAAGGAEGLLQPSGKFPGSVSSVSSPSSVMQFVTSWLLQLTLPDSSRMLGVEEVWPLLSQLQQLIVVSSSCLPKALVHVLLRGGVAAVVCGTEPSEVSSLVAADIAEFFRVFYAEGLWQGLDVVEALQAAVAAVPAVGDSAYECYQLM